MSCPLCTETFDCVDHIPIVARCGHSVCIECVRGGVLNHERFDISPLVACRTCSSPYAFNTLQHNHQMMEVLQVMRQSAIDRENEQKKLPTELSCHICASPIADKRARVCQPCCLEKKWITLNDDQTTVFALKLKELQASVMCGCCFLEGCHEGHKSILYLPILLRSVALMEYHNLQESIDSSCFESGAKKLKDVVDSLHRPLNRLQDSAHLTGSCAEFARVLATCKQQKREVDAVQKEFNDQVEKYAGTLKKIQHELNEAADFDAVTVITPALEAEITKTRDVGPYVAIKLLNKSSDQFVSFVVTRQPTVCNVVAPPNTTLSPGTSVLLEVSPKTGRTKERENMELFVTINYALHSTRDDRSNYNHTLVVPFEFP